MEWACCTLFFQCPSPLQEANLSRPQDLVACGWLQVVARVVPWQWSVQGDPGTWNAISDAEAISAVGFILSKNQEHQQAAAEGAKKLEMKRRAWDWLREFGRGVCLWFDTFGRVTRHQLRLGKSRWNGHAIQVLSLTWGRLSALLDSASWYHRARMRVGWFGRALPIGMLLFYNDSNP